MCGLWLLKRTVNATHDEIHAMIVRADSEQEARAAAALYSRHNGCFCESPNEWQRDDTICVDLLQSDAHDMGWGVVLVDAYEG